MHHLYIISASSVPNLCIILANFFLAPTLTTLLLILSPEGAVNLRVERLRLGEHPVDVLVEALEEVAEKLLAVLLVVPREPRGEPLDGGLQARRVDHLAGALPQALDDRAECWKMRFEFKV